MRQIPLTRGYVALVDDADYDRVMAAGPWQVRENRWTAYGQRRMLRPGVRQTTQSLHTFLTGWPLVDHANGDGLDNQRHNLRPATTSQNNANARRRVDNTSGFKGVSRYPRPLPWHARIQADRKMHHLGYYATPEEAARAYDRAALELFGEFARLNFPLEQAS